MPWGVLEHIWSQSELSHSGLKFTKNAIGLSVVGGKGVYSVVCGNSLEKPWFEWQLEAVWSLNAKQSGQQILPWSRTSVSTKVLLHKHRVIISNEVGYIQISLMRTCVFKKVWKTSKIYDGNRYLGNLLQIHFFPSEMLLESEALLCSFLSLNLMGNTFFVRILVYFVLKAISHFPWQMQITLPFQGLWISSFPSLFHDIRGQPCKEISLKWIHMVALYFEV